MPVAPHHSELAAGGSFLEPVSLHPGRSSGHVSPGPLLTIGATGAATHRIEDREITMLAMRQPDVTAVSAAAPRSADHRMPLERPATTAAGAATQASAFVDVQPARLLSVLQLSVFPPAVAVAVTSTGCIIYLLDLLKLSMMYGVLLLHGATAWGVPTPHPQLTTVSPDS